MLIEFFSLKIWIPIWKTQPLVGVLFLMRPEAMRENDRSDGAVEVFTSTWALLLRRGGVSPQPCVCVEDLIHDKCFIVMGGTMIFLS